MQYIVLDMEWNQPWPGSYAAQKVLPVQIHGEIIQIGAVRLLETGKIADEFQVPAPIFCVEPMSTRT